MESGVSNNEQVGIPLGQVVGGDPAGRASKERPVLWAEASDPRVGPVTAQKS